MNKKILIIVEGELEEPRILDAKGKGILNLISNDFEIVSYSTSIYDLYDAYIKGEYDDIVSYLVSKHKLTIGENDLPKTAFSAIYLIFDFEPHYQKYSDDTIIELLNLFDDETRMGKLYINYPMVESYYHLTELPDYEYVDRKVSLDNFNGSEYKKCVYNESCIKHKPVPRHIMQSIMKHNFIKAQTICETSFRNGIDHKSILSKQIEIKNSTNKIYVLNTLSLLPIDYNPDLFVKLMNTKLK